MFERKIPLSTNVSGALIVFAFAVKSTVASAAPVPSRLSTTVAADEASVKPNAPELPIFKSPALRLVVSIVTMRAAVSAFVKLITSPAAVPGTATGVQLVVRDQLPAASTFHEPPAASAEEGENEAIAASAAMLEVRMRAGFRVFMVVELFLSFAEKREERSSTDKTFFLSRNRNLSIKSFSTLRYRNHMA